MQKWSGSVFDRTTAQSFCTVPLLRLWSRITYEQLRAAIAELQAETGEAEVEMEVEVDG